MEYSGKMECDSDKQLSKNFPTQFPSVTSKKSYMLTEYLIFENFKYK